MGEYEHCKHLRRPLYNEIDQVVRGICRHYVRLMLPLIEDKGEITKIAYVTRGLLPNYYFNSNSPDMDKLFPKPALAMRRVRRLAP